MRKIKQKGKKAKKKQKSSKTEKKIHNKSTEIRQIGCQSTIPSGWKARPIVPFLPNPLLILFSLYIYILFLAFHLPPALLLSLLHLQLHLLPLLLRSSFVISERGKCTKNVQREREREREEKIPGDMERRKGLTSWDNLHKRKDSRAPNLMLVQSCSFTTLPLTSLQLQIEAEEKWGTLSRLLNKSYFFFFDNFFFILPPIAAAVHESRRLSCPREDLPFSQWGSVFLFKNPKRN